MSVVIYMRYVWLVYLGGAVLTSLVFNPSTDALDWLAVAALIALFLPIYAARRSGHATT